MPTFNVLRIDEKHLAKVKAARSRVEVSDKADKNLQQDFLKWHKGIKKMLSNQKAFTSSIIVHTFE